MEDQRDEFCSLLCYNVYLQDKISSIGKAGIVANKKAS